MQKIFLSMVAALMLTAAINAQAETPTPTPETGENGGGNSTIVLLPPQPPKIKRMPSKFAIECSYSGGMLTFMPAPFYEVLTVTVSNLDINDEWSEIITSDDNSIMLEDGSRYFITAITPNGKTFQGTIY